MKEAATLVYRTRNWARTLNEAARADSASVSRTEIQQLLQRQKEIQELLFEAVAVLPQSIFSILHRQKHALFCYCLQVERLTLHQKVKSNPRRKALDSLQKLFLNVDSGYHELTEAIRAELGVSQ